MKILLCGADGFIGRHLKATLGRAGHTVIAAQLRKSVPEDVVVDYRQDITAAHWLPRLHGIDVVINAVGTFAEKADADFTRIHATTPCALFSACAEAGVHGVIQLSALGAEGGEEEENQTSHEKDLPPFLRSKGEADRFLARLVRRQPSERKMQAWVVRPSLVYGDDGASAALLRQLASLPFLVLPLAGKVQPIHIDDLCALVTAIVARIVIAEDSAPPVQFVTAVGARALTLRELIAVYRRGLGFGRSFGFTLPRFAAEIVASLAAGLTQPWITRDTLRLLRKDNTAERAQMLAMEALLGHAPRDPASFIDAATARALAADAVLGWSIPFLRLTLAFLWIFTAALSFGLYPVQESLRLLAPFEFSTHTAYAALYAGAVFDLLCGLLTLCYPRRALWVVQIALIAVYTVLISFWLPHWWLHPFGPVTKNLPILALLVLLAALPEASSGKAHIVQTGNAARNS